MARWERRVPRTRDEQLRRLVELAGADAVHPVFQQQVAQKQAQQQGQQHLQAGAPLPPVKEQNAQAQGDPDHAAVAQAADKGHEAIQKAVMAVGRDPI